MKKRSDQNPLILLRRLRAASFSPAGKDSDLSFIQPLKDTILMIVT